MIPCEHADPRAGGVRSAAACRDRAAADGDLAAVAVVTAADPSRIGSTDRGHLAAVDLYLAALAAVLCQIKPLQ